MEGSDVRTTATSEAEGRLKVASGCSHGRNKCLKCVVGLYKKDGKGGPGLGAPGYGSSKTKTTISLKTYIPKAKKTRVKKIAGLKMGSIGSTIKSLNKNLKFGKTLKNKKMTTLKSMIKGIL